MPKKSGGMDGTSRRGDVRRDLRYARYGLFAELVGARRRHLDGAMRLDGAIDSMAAFARPCLVNVDLRRLVGPPLADSQIY